MFDRIKRAFKAVAEKVIEKVATEELSEEKLEPILWDFKVALLESDVALDVADAICEGVKARLVGRRVGRLEDKRALVEGALRDSLLDVLSAERLDFFEEVERARAERRPMMAVFVGINGSGKTTTIAKLAKKLLDRGYSVALACSDTYRAGAIEQLEAHAKRLGVRMIKHPYGSDPAAVAYDAKAFAKSKGINAVLVDTSGRMETNVNLMEEMRKIVRVSSPDLVVFVGDALTGNDAVAQASEFAKYVPISGSILTKMDADAKGGAAISIAYVTKKPILFLGVGQGYDDLIPFDPRAFVDQIIGPS